MNFFDYDEMKRTENECKKILDRCKASEEDIKRIYENANNVVFEVIDEFKDIGVVYALKFSLMREIADYIRDMFDVDSFVYDYGYGKYDMYIDGVHVLDYEFF